MEGGRESTASANRGRRLAIAIADFCNKIGTKLTILRSDGMFAFGGRADMTPMGYRIASRADADVMDTLTR